jgi:hypothetical protein
MFEIDVSTLLVIIITFIIWMLVVNYYFDNVCGNKKVTQQSDSAIEGYADTSVTFKPLPTRINTFIANPVLPPESYFYMQTIKDKSTEAQTWNDDAGYGSVSYELMDMAPNVFDAEFNPSLRASDRDLTKFTVSRSSPYLNKQYDEQETIVAHEPNYTIKYDAYNNLSNMPKPNYGDSYQNTANGTKSDDRMRPWNDIQTMISYAQVLSPVVNEEHYDNSYFNLWRSDLATEAENIEKNAKALASDGDRCFNYQNINQCMTECNNTKYCVGFYVDKVPTPAPAPDSGITPTNPLGDVDGRCCLLESPPFDTDRHSYMLKPGNMSYDANNRFNNMIEARGLDPAYANKPVFKVFGNNQTNTTYTANIPFSQCQSYCPKCVRGKCPSDYRCVNVTTDPRIGNTCLITNEDRYDEQTGNTFDSSNIPYLNPSQARSAGSFYLSPNDWAKNNDNQYDNIYAPGYDVREIIPADKNYPNELNKLQQRSATITNEKSIEKIYDQAEKQMLGPNTSANWSNTSKYDIVWNQPTFAENILPHNINALDALDAQDTTSSISGIPTDTPPTPAPTQVEGFSGVSGVDALKKSFNSMKNNITDYINKYAQNEKFDAVSMDGTNSLATPGVIIGNQQQTKEITTPITRYDPNDLNQFRMDLQYVLDDLSYALDQNRSMEITQDLLQTRDNVLKLMNYLNNIQYNQTNTGSTSTQLINASTQLTNANTQLTNTNTGSTNIQLTNTGSTNMQHINTNNSSPSTQLTNTNTGSTNMQHINTNNSSPSTQKMEPFGEYMYAPNQLCPLSNARIFKDAKYNYLQNNLHIDLKHNLGQIQ